MKKLFTLTDTFHRDLPFVTAPDYVNFYSQPDGSGIPIPNEATYVGVSVVESGAWVKLGPSDSTLTPPAEDITDGTAPMWVNDIIPLIAWVENNDYIYIHSSDDVVVRFWS